MLLQQLQYYLLVCLSRLFTVVTPVTVVFSGVFIVGVIFHSLLNFMRVENDHTCKQMHSCHGDQSAVTEPEPQHVSEVHSYERS